MNITRQLFPDFPFHTVESLRIRIGWYINLRWLAIFVLLISIPLAKLMLELNLGFEPLTVLAALLIMVNILSFFFFHYLPAESEKQELLFAEIMILADLIILSLIIHYSGGIENPFFILYLVQVIYSAIFFPGTIIPISNALFAAFLLTLWTIMEYNGIVQRYTLVGEPLSRNLIITGLAAFYLTNFAGIFIINNFMYRYRELKRKIDEKSVLLEESIRQRNRLFRFTAHEVKAPITTVQSTLAVLKKLAEKEHPSQLSDLIQRAEKRTGQVLSMVKEMIDISKYNLSAEHSDKVRLEFSEFVCTQITAFQAYAQSKKIEMIFQKPAHPLNVCADPGSLEKIVNNIVMNALRYTPESGRVEIEVFRNGSCYGFRVADNGIGIKEEEIPLIFNEFYRTKDARDMEQIGTGLGLNLVQGIVSNIGGKIRVDSTPGQGSCFTITFPFEVNNDLEN